MKPNATIAVFGILTLTIGCGSSDTGQVAAAGSGTGGGAVGTAGTNNRGGNSTSTAMGGAPIGLGGNPIAVGGVTTSAGNGGIGGGSSDACILPGCLTALGCVPSGACSMDDDPGTGNKTVSYANGITQISILDVTDYSTALTVKDSSTTCFTTAYIGNDFSNAAGELTVKDAAGNNVATLWMDATSSHYLITCANAQPVSVDKSCSKTWPLSGLTTVPSTSCVAPATGGTGAGGTGAGGTSAGVAGAGGTSAGGTGAGGTGAGGTGAGGTGAGGTGAGGTGVAGSASDAGGTTNGGSSSGGTTSVGGSVSAGGNTSGGTPSDPGRVRTILPLDRDWRFSLGNPTGAEQTTFADSDWRGLNVPHDWSIEGPFSASAPTTGRGGYVPAGMAWYRKHFTLPQSLSGRKIYVEFDGVMENSTVYVNGVQLGNHPYGYVSFRYDMTSSVEFGATDNVLAVKADTSLQPNSRYYAGSGIYRHVRIIAADPVQVEQWATQVTTPQPTASVATVHVQTSVVNSGTATASVSVQGVVSDVSGASALPSVSTPAQSIAAGASASFSFDVSVASPRLWSPDAPNLYRLVTSVLVGETAVDDDVTNFGIRSLTYDAATGLSINGKSTKFQGACLHQDYHGLGMAAPQRAMQRRLAQLKTYGVNAVRTGHDPPSPEFLDLCDRMGILVMDEFFDVWTTHKYTDVGDYATYFNKTATNPSGMPSVPGTTNPKWFEVDVTGIVMRDRNHPSVALYSAGNEIRDALATRTPILTRIADLVHALDPSRPVTQGLFRPSDSGDITGATRTLLDVFGGNYRSAEVLQGMQASPARAGVLTEMGTQTSTWAVVNANPGLTGSFMWTGVDYLGEADGAWPIMGASFGMLDALGTPKSIAFSWQTTWGLSRTTFSTGAEAGKVVLTADHSAITNDLNDAAFVKAAVPTATAAVTFGITGPGVIVAVDSGSQTQEPFRGNTRNAFGGLAFAVVQATGPGTITVTATSSGLTDGTATIQATEGSFVPCSGSCD